MYPVYHGGIPTPPGICLLYHSGYTIITAGPLHRCQHARPVCMLRREEALGSKREKPWVGEERGSQDPKSVREEEEFCADTSALPGENWG